MTKITTGQSSPLISPPHALESQSDHSILSSYALTARSWRGDEKVFRDSIGEQVLKRMGEFTKLASLTTEQVLHVCSTWIENKLGTNNRTAVERAGEHGKPLTLDTAAAFVPVFTPLSVGETLFQIRSAAILAHEKPELAKEARAELLLGLADVSGAAVGLASYSHPLLAVSATILTTGIKWCNAACNYFWKPEDDLRQTAASHMAERYGVKQSLDLLLKIIYKTDKGIVTGFNSLKDEFAPSAGQKQHAYGERLLSEFHKIYEATYPDAQAESIQAMRDYLGKGPELDSWNIRVLLKNEKDAHGKPIEKVVGGFTFFTIEHPEFGTQLIIEQVLPAFSSNPEVNSLAWKEIYGLAALSGAKRIWLESQEKEMLPHGFKEIDMPYAQPALRGKESSGPVGLGSEDKLKMSVLSLDSATPLATEREYSEVVTKNTETWANANCPAMQLLKANPCRDLPLNFIAATETSEAVQAPTTAAKRDAETLPKATQIEVQTLNATKDERAESKEVRTAA